MNYKNDDMDGVISPTDSRFRPDLRLFEEGQIDESDKVKIQIEEQQRLIRKNIEEGNQPPWECKFFRRIKHPYITKDIIDTGEDEIDFYELIENDGDNKGYWERRLRKDWDDMPHLWPPFGNE